MGPSLPAACCRCGQDHRRLTASGRGLYSARFATPALSGGPLAPVAELVDALDSKSSSARSAGSIPARGTKSSLVEYFQSVGNRPTLSSTDPQTFTFEAHLQKINQTFWIRLSTDASFSGAPGSAIVLACAVSIA